MVALAYGRPRRSHRCKGDLYGRPGHRARRRVFHDGTEVPLAPREFDLLLHLATNAGRPFGRAMLLDQVWGWDYAGDTRTVDKHIAELRRKLEDDPASPRYILTVRGVGYTFRDW